MFEGWRWRYSREVELFAMVATVIGSRIPLNDEPVDFDKLTKGWPLYRDND